MASTAQRDQEARKVEVNRQELLKKLKENLAKHIVDYNNAMSGYKNLLSSKIDEGYVNAKVTIEENYNKIKEKVGKFTNEDISKQKDMFTIMDGIYVSMKVPKIFDKEYQMAIDIFEWDVREIVQLSYAEFTCFVLDQWDWQSEFKSISAMYKA